MAAVAASPADHCVGETVLPAGQSAFQRPSKRSTAAAALMAEAVAVPAAPAVLALPAVPAPLPESVAAAPTLDLAPAPAVPAVYAVPVVPAVQLGRAEAQPGVSARRATDVLQAVLPSVSSAGRGIAALPAAPSSSIAQSANQPTSLSCQACGGILFSSNDDFQQHRAGEAHQVCHSRIIAEPR